jgi:hypothetical protein
VRTVAGAEPAAKVTGFTNGDTTKVSADTFNERKSPLSVTIHNNIAKTDSVITYQA